MSGVNLIEQSSPKYLVIKERAVCRQYNALEDMSVLYTIVEHLVSLGLRRGESFVAAVYL
jgi:hypothetical protein